jgi:hypothetical protein
MRRKDHGRRCEKRAPVSIASCRRATIAPRRSLSESYRSRARCCETTLSQARAGKSSCATRRKVSSPPSWAVASGPAPIQRGARPSATAESMTSASATPASSRCRHSRRTASYVRFQMKPGTSHPRTTGVLERLSAQATPPHARKARAWLSGLQRSLRLQDRLLRKFQGSVEPRSRPRDARRRSRSWLRAVMITVAWAAAQAAAIPGVMSPLPTTTTLSMERGPPTYPGNLGRGTSTSVQSASNHAIAEAECARLALEGCGSPAPC